MRRAKPYATHHLKVAFLLNDLGLNGLPLPALPMGATRAYRWGDQVIADNKNGTSRYLLLNGSWIAAFPE